MMKMIWKAQIPVRGNLTIYPVSTLKLVCSRADTPAWLDDGTGEGRGTDAQEDDDDLREDPVAQIDMIVSHSFLVF
jgi:hypothetical protein